MGLNNLSIYIISALSAVIGILIGFFLRKRIAGGKIAMAEELAEKIINEAKREAETKKKELLLETKEKWYRDKADFEKETEEKRTELKQLEQRIMQREENLERKLDSLEKREREIREREVGCSREESRVKELEVKYKSILDEELRKLEAISGMSQTEAKNEIKTRVEDEARLESAERLRKVEEDLRKSSIKKAQDILSQAIQRCASDYVAETTVSVVDLPNDEMKGRIIGREGRNIRALEIATGADLIIDDTPEAVIISAFDPIKREITRIALEQLIADGRIHPGRIEEVVNKVKKDLMTKIHEEGEQAAFDVGVNNLHPEQIKLLGRLRYRTSYSQNVLQHSKEVAWLCGIMAEELGLDVKVAKRAGLLHDIGKAVDHQTEGTHTQIGVDIAKRYNESKIVVNAIAAHHEDIEAHSPIAVLVGAADALSAARPGARREVLESYVKRLEKLEEIGDSFKGVEKTFAIQAGREVRVIVHPEKISDNEATILARDIARKIETDLAYPGEIKITLIRETRVTEYAR